MADETTSPASQAGRAGGNREGGGFRIRLSENEMRAARTIQEAFRLRSTVAVLGFSVRTVAQLLEEGKLDALLAQQQAQGGGRDGGRSAGDGGREGGRGGRGARPERVQRQRIDPFARPSRPVPAPAAEAGPGQDSPPEAEAAGDDAAPTSEITDSES